jgi:hypothetical protein
MKQLVFIVTILFLVFGFVEFQKARTEPQEEISNVVFSNQEIKDLANGEIVNKSSSVVLSFPVKLVPVVEVAYYKVISSYKFQKGKLRKIPGTGLEIISQKPNLILSFFWLYSPVILIFLFAYFSSGKKEKGEKEFIYFFAVMSLIIAVSIIIGKSNGSFVGWIFGWVAGIIAVTFYKSTLKKVIAILTGLSAFAFTGLMAGSFLEIPPETGVSDVILWHYLIIYIAFCFLGFGLRMVIATQKDLVASN